MKFGTLDENNKLALAPKVFRYTDDRGKILTVVNPSEALLRKHGYLPIDETPPIAPVGYYAVVIGYSLAASGASIVAEYEIEKLPPPPPKIYSVPKLVRCLLEVGLWEEVVKPFIVSAGLHDLFLVTPSFSEDDELFKNAIISLSQDPKVQAVLSPEQINEILVKCEEG